MANNKKIIDSVHGNILVDSEYVTNIIDTPEFQRLRRIEQTSIRAIFPCARHDRFIHSIGVYYLGSLFVKQIEEDINNAIPENLHITDAEYKQIRESYKIACLVHDIGHAPFSHTLEELYGSKHEKLKQDIEAKIPHFSLTERALNNAKHHELASVYVAASVEKIRSFIDSVGNIELVARMIIGFEYSDDTAYHQICNCFISLLNGKVIDADRLDYACRDVWASGYCTSTIDVIRLISGLHISNDDGKYKVCFDVNVLNEITSVVNIKDFQVRYVLNHHIVKYEQELLERGVKDAAIELSTDVNEAQNKENLYSQFINYKTITEVIPYSNFKITRIADDDIIFLMKQCEHNHYFEEWSSRQYKKFALWKTIDEFYAIFEDIPRDIAIDNTKIEESLRCLLKERFGLDSENDILILPVVFKARVQLNSLMIRVKEHILPYEKLYRGALEKEQEKIFMYVYISKGEKTTEEIDIFRKEIIESIRTLMTETYVFPDTKKWIKNMHPLKKIKSLIFKIKSHIFLD